MSDQVDDMTKFLPQFIFCKTASIGDIVHYIQIIVLNAQKAQITKHHNISSQNAEMFFNLI